MKRYGKAQSRRSKQADRYVPKNTDDLGGADVRVGTAATEGSVAASDRLLNSTSIATPRANKVPPIAGRSPIDIAMVEVIRR